MLSLKVFTFITLSFLSSCFASAVREASLEQNLDNYVNMVTLQLENKYINEESNQFFKKYIIPKTYGEYKIADHACRLGLKLHENNHYFERGLAYILFAEQYHIPDALILINRIARDVIKGVPENIKQLMKSYLLNEKDFYFKYELYEQIETQYITQLLKTPSPIQNLAKGFLRYCVHYSKSTKPIIKNQPLLSNDNQPSQLIPMQHVEISRAADEINEDEKTRLINKKNS